MAYLDLRVNFTRFDRVGLIKISKESFVAGRMVVINPTLFRTDISFWSWGMDLVGSGAIVHSQIQYTRLIAMKGWPIDERVGVSTGIFERV